jgi:GNAT superfamily N-acetyltransferase
MADMVRELAENPNVHQPVLDGRTLHLDPAGRFAIFFVPGTYVHCATVQRVRLEPGAVEPALAEIRALLRERGREGAEWELGDSTMPSDLVERLLALGLQRDADEPVAIGLVLRGTPSWTLPPTVFARRARSSEELRAAWTLQRAAFHDPRPIDDQRLAGDFEREGEIGSTFVAFDRALGDAPIGAAYAAYTRHGLLLFGGAVAEPARGRGAYRALVAARAQEAAARGTPVLVTHAGKMSRPILERLGFEPIARLDRLIDRLA